MWDYDGLWDRYAYMRWVARQKREPKLVGRCQRVMDWLRSRQRTRVRAAGG